MHFDAFWLQFLEASPDLRPATVDLYSRFARLYLLPEFGDKRMAEIGHLDVSAWVGRMATRGIGQPTISVSLRLLRAMFNKALAAEIVGRNPTKGVRAPAPENRQMRFLSGEEVHALAEATPERYRTLIYFLAYGGPRIGEAAALKVENLNLLRGEVTIQASLNEVAGHVQVGPTKTGGTRTITLPPFLRDMVGEHIARYASPEGWLFPSPDGGPLRPNNFRKRVFHPAVR
ncbi:MAG TPA: hypothetical protein DIT48_06500, partial [Actinobacteria bacterium]|nr:hypothetical protein [Actinomycetota bacterium]